MREELIDFAKKKLIKAFGYLSDFGYKMARSCLTENGFMINYNNGSTKKDIDFTISDSEDVARFFIVVSIIKNPYLTVNDFISFDAYLKKNYMPFLSSLEGDQTGKEAIEKYIDEYSILFKKYGIPLIESDKQFPGYYPEWT